MKLFKKNENKKTTKLPMTKKVKKGLPSIRNCIYRMRIWSVGFPLPARQSIIL